VYVLRKVIPDQWANSQLNRSESNWGFPLHRRIECEVDKNVEKT
jgi:hypothetical protein